MAQKIIMDVDTGCDDAVALMLAVNSPELDLLAVGTTHGNVEADVAALNTLKVLERVGRGDIPVAIGAAAPLNQPLATARSVHGKDGLGNIHLPAPLGKATDEHAALQIIRLTRQYPGEVTIIAVGPLTNLALALGLSPDLPRRVKEVIIMGGSAGTGGNTWLWSEANIGNDPEAAARVFAAPWPLQMIGLDVTMQCWLTREMHTELGRQVTSPAAQLAYRILEFYIGFYRKTYGRDGCAQHDALAVAAAIDPSLVKTKLLPVHVELRGEHTRGMTAVDLRALRKMGQAAAPAEPDGPGQARVALAVDSDRFLRLLMTRLGAPGPQ